MKLPGVFSPTRRGILLAAALLLAGLGPGPAHGQAQSCATQERLITEPVDFDIESHLFQRMEATGAFVTLRKFDFQEKKLPPELGEPIHHISDLRVEDGFLKFRTTGRDPYFTLRGLNVPAEEVSAIAVRAVFETTEDRLVDELNIFFTTDREPKFSGERKLVAQVETDGKLRTVLLFTGTDRVSGWQGTITRLRVDPVRSEQKVAIREIALLKATGDIDFSALELPPTGVARTWTAQVLQNVVFARFAAPVEWTLTLPCEPKFHAQIALPGMYRPLGWRPFHVLVELQDTTGEWTTISRVSIDKSTAQRVFQEVDLQLALDRWSAQRVTLRLTAVAAEAGSAPGGFVYWINPYVTSRRSSPKRPNIILISIDTLRADHLSLYGYPRRTSPHLDTWAKKGTTFTSAISQSPWTLPSHASLFTSLYPSQHQAIFESVKRGHLSEVFETLAERLQQNGYITGGFAGALWVSWQVNLDQGFDFWSQPFEFGRDFSQVSAWLDRHASARFFLFLHTYEVHNYPSRTNFDIIRRRAAIFYPGYRGKVMKKDFNYRNHYDKRLQSYRKTKDLNRDDLRFLEAMYDGQILAVDEALGRLFEELSRRGLEEDTVVIVTSDHGEEFNEHGGLNHGHSLYDEMIRVPLIIRYPRGLPQGHLVTQQVRLIDLYPTVLELAGLPVPEGLEGRSFVPLLRGQDDGQERVAFSEEPQRRLSGVRTQSAKYIYRGGERLAFDLIKDPLEQYPDVHPPDVEKIIALHDQFMAKNGGYHFLARGPRLDGCPIRLTTDGRFVSAIPRFTELPDTLTTNNKQLDITFTLKDGDVDGLYFLVYPALASIKVEMCQREGKAGGGVEVRFGANEPVRMKAQWSVGQEIAHEAVRVSTPPIQRPADLRADVALWHLETVPGADEKDAELSPAQRDEFLRRLRSLGYLQ